MAKDKKILTKIIQLSKDLEADWEEGLTEINIWDDVEGLYTSFDRKEANIFMAYIAFAYDASSDKLTVHKDRLQNKKVILTKLAGEATLKKELYIDALLGGNAIIDNVIEFYINNQRDWRWTTVISSLEFASKVRAKSFNADKETGDLLDQADKRMEKANKMLDQLREEYVDLDSVLEKEEKVKITDRIEDTDDFMSWEKYVKKAQYESARTEAEDREKTAGKTNRKKVDIPETDQI